VSRLPRRFLPTACHPRPVEGMATAVGPPQALGPPRQEGREVHRLHDFWATPGSGSCGRARWQQTMGTMVVRLMLRGPPWQGAEEGEFQVRLCERGIRVSNKHRPEADEAFLRESLNGDFPQEVLPRSCWWALEPAEEGHTLGDQLLVVHLVKAKDKSWSALFLEGKPACAADLSADWVSPGPGRRPEFAAEIAELNLRPEDLLQELSVSQTEELVTLRFLLSQAKLDEAKRHVPPSRLWALDIAEDRLELRLRCCPGGPPLLRAGLGGRVVPQQADWSLVKVTRDVGAGADGVGARETRPALSVLLRKAPESKHEWEQILVQEELACAAPEAPIGALDDDGEAARLPELANGEEPNRDGWGPEDHAKELKARGDECFRKLQWEPAIEFYTKALAHMPNNEKLLSNRSAAFMETKQYQAALDDALRCAEVAPQWPKSFFRQGVALRALRRYDMALSAFSEGRGREPKNPSWQSEIEETEERKAARQAARQARGGR